MREIYNLKCEHMELLNCLLQAVWENWFQFKKGKQFIENIILLIFFEKIFVRNTKLELC